MVDNELLSAISDMLDSKLQPIESRLGTIETRMESIESRLVSVESKVDSIDSTVTKNRELFLEFYEKQMEQNTEINRKLDITGACVDIFSKQTIENTVDLKRIK